MKRIICHGDSLTEGKDIKVAYRWPSLLQNALGTEVINTGIGGDTTTGLLSRFSTDVIPRKPDLVILMGGINDFWWGLSINTVIANLFTMAYHAQFHGIAFETTKGVNHYTYTGLLKPGLKQQLV